MRHILQHRLPALVWLASGPNSVSSTACKTGAREHCQSSLVERPAICPSSSPHHPLIRRLLSRKRLVHLRTGRVVPLVVPDPVQLRETRRADEEVDGGEGVVDRGDDHRVPDLSVSGEIHAIHIGKRWDQYREDRRTQMKPVAASAMFWLVESFSAGRPRSFSPAATSPHLASGAQKKMVLRVSTQLQVDRRARPGVQRCKRSWPRPREQKDRAKLTWARRGGS